MTAQPTLNASGVLTDDQPGAVVERVGTGSLQCYAEVAVAPYEGRWYSSLSVQASHTGWSSPMVPRHADGFEDMASALRRLADDVERNELTVGCSGAPHDGAIYELLHDPEMTHDRYFTELREYLDQQRVKRSVAPLEPHACMVCGEHHGNGLPCPRMTPTAGGA